MVTLLIPYRNLEPSCLRYLFNILVLRTSMGRTSVSFPPRIRLGSLLTEALQLVACNHPQSSKSEGLTGLWRLSTNWLPKSNTATGCRSKLVFVQDSVRSFRYSFCNIAIGSTKIVESCTSTEGHIVKALNAHELGLRPATLTKVQVHIKPRQAQTERGRYT